MNLVNMADKEFKTKCLAIVMFGPAVPTSGMRPAEFYQVTIDPEKRSPSGEYIRFGLHQGDEIQGWQKVSALTVCEVLAEWDGDEKPTTLPIHSGGVTMRVINGDASASPTSL